MRRVIGSSALVVGAVVGISGARAQRPPSHSHAFYMTAVEFKGSTTTDRLGPPRVDPTKLSHGYVFKAPGQEPLGIRGAQAIDDGRDHGASALGVK